MKTDQKSEFYEKLEAKESHEGLFLSIVPHLQQPWGCHIHV